MVMMSLLGRRTPVVGLRAFIVPIAVLLGTTTGVSLAHAQSTPAHEYGELIRSQRNLAPLDAGLLGEQVDLNTGRTVFVATDVSLPGNNALPVAVGRKYSVGANPTGAAPRGYFGDWDLDIPHIEGIVATAAGWVVPGGSPNNRCTGFGTGPDGSGTTTTPGGTAYTPVGWDRYATGFALVMPGGGSRELLRRDPGNSQQPSDGLSYPIVTNDWWVVRCKNQLAAGSAGSGEGFIAKSPEGVEYTFDWLVERTHASLLVPADIPTQPGAVATLARTRVWMMPTSAKDRFGNTVTYQWDGERLTGIEGSDGRQINVTYTVLGGRSHIRTINDNSKTWTYNYRQIGGDFLLDTVSLPGGPQWKFDLEDLTYATWTYSSATSCGVLSTPSLSSAVSGEIQHPTGAQGTFSFRVKRHGRNGAPTTCYSTGGTAFAQIQPSLWDVLSLVEKKISGPRLGGTLTWSFDYSGCTSSSCGTTKRTTVGDPRGYDTRYTFGAKYDDDEGLLLKLEKGGTGSGFDWVEDYTYFSASGQAYPSLVGTPAQVRGDAALLTKLRPVRVRDLTVDGSGYTRTMSNLDAYGFPKTIARSGSHSKTDQITYDHNTSKWVLGTVQRVVGSGTEELSLTLNSNNLPTQVQRFGETVASYGYNSDGTMDWSRDGANNQTNYGSWRRGIPQTSAHSGSGSESVDVNNQGKITSWTDENSRRTDYAYTDEGLLDWISPPDVSTTASETSISWSTGSSGWSSTESTAGYQKSTDFDAFLRPVLTTETGAGTRYIRREFDVDGRPTFVSYPGATSGTADGTNYEYDGLGRLTKETDAGGYYRSYDYQSGGVVRVRDRNGQIILYKYKSFDEPNTEWLTQVDGPLYVTYIDRDDWGNPTSMTRSGTTAERRWAYGTGKRLCAVYSSEQGTTRVRYDGAGNLKASEHVGTSWLGCAALSAAQIVRTYDSRNRLTGVSYPDSSLDIVQTWFNNGLLESASRNGIVHEFTYNGLRQPVTQKTTIDGVVFNLKYDYTGKGALSSRTYPDNSVVTNDPDNFGQPTKAGTYVTGGAYHRNGLLSNLNYANGIAYSLTLNNRDLPLRRKYGSVYDRTFTYDGDSNVVTVTDSLVGNTHTMALAYDEGGRLKTANASGLWGNGNFTYDNSDNLKTSTLGAVSTTYTISAATNRVTSYSRSGVSTSVNYDSRGNMQTKGTATYVFDQADQLKEITGRESYRYDAFGYRVEKHDLTTSNGNYERYINDISGRMLHSIRKTGAPLVGGSGTWNIFKTNYIYLGDLLVAERVQQDQGTSGSGGGTLSQTTITYTHPDQVSTVAARTDGSANVIPTPNYEPYGKRYQSGGIGFSFPVTGFDFAGQYRDRDGLIFMQARYHDPDIGRFISPDPVGALPSSGGNFNRYAYANNSPYRFRDPNGQIPLDTLVDAGFTIYDAGRFLGATIAFGVGKATGDAELTQVAWAGLGDTGTDLAMSAGSTLLPYVSAPVARLGATVAKSADDVAGGATTLYRAVGPDELADIQSTGVLRNLGSAEGKYFTASGEEASAYAKQAVNAFGDQPYTIVRTDIPTDLLHSLGKPTSVDRGIPAWVVPNDALKGLTPEILNYSPLPPSRF